MLSSNRGNSCGSVQKMHWSWSLRTMIGSCSMRLFERVKFGLSQTLGFLFPTSRRHQTLLRWNGSRIWGWFAKANEHPRGISTFESHGADPRERPSSADSGMAFFGYPISVTTSLFTVALLYYFGAKVGFFLTMGPHPVSTLWPSNAILMGMLLVAPTRHWKLFVLAVCRRTWRRSFATACRR